jgi:vancomycin resistance protein VanJ
MDQRVTARSRSRAAALLSPWLPLFFLGLVWAGKQLIGERWWLTTWCVYLPQSLFLLPSVLMIGLCLQARRWRLAIGQAAVAMVGVGLLFSGVYRVPRPVRRGDLRVMTWNIMGLGGDPAGVLALIHSEQPDVLLLQEASRARGPDPVPWLIQRLPGWEAVRAADVAILSPHPLGPPRRASLGPRDTTRVSLRTTMRVGGRSLEVVTVHFNTGLPSEPIESAWVHPRHHMAVAAAVRAEQADHLAENVAAAPRPLILGGDFNSPPDSRACRTMTQQLDSAFDTAGAGFGWTFPASHPLLRIDHLFISRDLEALSCRVVPTPASDHRALVADLAWASAAYPVRQPEPGK